VGFFVGVGVVFSIFLGGIYKYVIEYVFLFFIFFCLFVFFFYIFFFLFVKVVFSVLGIFFPSVCPCSDCLSLWA
jgi:hypothetical protein